MKLSLLQAASILSALFAKSNAELSGEELVAVEALFQDIGENQSEYYSYIVENASSFVFPTDLIAIYTQITTYTDDSYTSLFDDIKPTELSAIESLMTELPWYSTRLGPAIASAEVAAAAATVTESAAVSSYAAKVSSKLLTTTLPKSSSIVTVSKSASVSTASDAVTKSASASSSAAASSSSSAGANNIKVVGGGAAALIGIFGYLLI
ncbi:hypothetical protein CANARDRAFT_150147 [[Candida] arabinofermentans NRRL YB-2248]|uniref:Uncharacterized protein n=1 Tax=[Candida] arabinofermentans NRRL YB-2248 TaxID=983967 RepID=A0A1E4T2U3_9ASCO|nr:hypothetical protein CANARDRAFT_150147 [[Candida] arabinofermentans NRRL YB-2248]